MRFRPEIDYYEVLQVHPRASAEMVRKAYRTLMGEMGGHPDLGGDEERAKLINEAYATLGDPDVRRAYDQARARVRPGAYESAGGGWPGGWAGSAGPAASAGELARWSAFVTKLLFSAIVVVVGMMVARLIENPTVDLADMIATIVVLLRIWQQAGGAR